MGHDGTYTIEDTGATHAQGRTTAGLSDEVHRYASSIKTKATAVDAGTRHGAGSVTSAAHDLGADLYADAGALARAVENLGNATSNVGTTVQETENETTAVQTQNTVLNRDINTSSSAPITSEGGGGGAPAVGGGHAGPRGDAHLVAAGQVVRDDHAQAWIEQVEPVAQGQLVEDHGEAWIEGTGPEHHAHLVEDHGQAWIQGGEVHAELVPQDAIGTEGRPLVGAPASRDA